MPSPFPRECSSFYDKGEKKKEGEKRIVIIWGGVFPSSSPFHTFVEDEKNGGEKGCEGNIRSFSTRSKRLLKSPEKWDEREHWRSHITGGGKASEDVCLGIKCAHTVP